MRKTQLQKHISDPNRCFRKLRSSPRLCFARFFLINSIEGARRRREFHPPATRPLGQILTSPFLFNSLVLHLRELLCALHADSWLVCCRASGTRQPRATALGNHTKRRPIKLTDTSGHSFTSCGEFQCGERKPVANPYGLQEYARDLRPSCATPSGSPSTVAALRRDPQSSSSSSG